MIFVQLMVFRISWIFALFLKSEAFSSKISELVSFATTCAIVVLPVPGEPLEN